MLAVYVIYNYVLHKILNFVLNLNKSEILLKFL